MKLHVLQGPNFSGRSHRIREWVGLPDSLGEAKYLGNAFIGPDAADGFSGISPTVGAEIELMAADSPAAFQAKQAMEMLGFGYCLDQNPFTLSGGEQIVAGIIVATAARPQRLGIDCALEQLSSKTRTDLLQYLQEQDGDLMIADNRLDEWYSGPSEVLDNDHIEKVENTDPPKTDNAFQQIELVDLSFAYIKGQPILKNFNLKVERGKQYILNGPNGSGKTTLAKILCGLLKPNSGEIRIEGRAVRPWRNPGKYVGYSFQNPDYQLFATSVGRQLRYCTQDEALVRWFGLENAIDTHPLDLPFVLKKRVALASTINKKNSCMVIDEPTLAQDRKNALKAKAVLNGLSGIVISHSKIYSDYVEVKLTKQRNGL